MKPIVLLGHKHRTSDVVISFIVMGALGFILNHFTYYPAPHLFISIAVGIGFGASICGTSMILQTIFPLKRKN